MSGSARSIERRVAAYRDRSIEYGDREAVRTAVAGSLELAGLDASRAGTAGWNPLGELIAPGETVLLKPNWVKAHHARRPEDWRAITTQTPVLEALARFVFRALEGRGTVLVADAPQTDTSFADLRERLELDRFEREFRREGLDLRVIDLRAEEWRAGAGVIESRQRLAGDPAGYVAFDLGAASEFAGHEGAGRYYGADYDAGEVNRHHQSGRHEYLIARSAIAADVIFSVPKLKTHKKTGLTAGLKNLVGINGDKNWLPHHTEWSWRARGDERPAWGWRAWAERGGAAALRTLSRRWPAASSGLHRWARRRGETVFGETDRVIRSGNWHGNDTCWRMCLDLNKIAFYGRPDGTLRTPGPGSRRRYFVLADGIVAGEGPGPMTPDPVQAGLVLFGTHPASVDAAAAVLMGFDPARIPLVREAFGARPMALAEWDWREVELASNIRGWQGALPQIDPDGTLGFTPHPGWSGHIERTGVRSAA